MGCNCKSKNDVDSTVDGDVISNRKLSEQIGIYTLKFLGFLVMVAMLPIINIVIIWFIFNTLVLNKAVNLKPLLTKIGGSFSQKEKDYYDDDDDDDDDYDKLTSDDVVMINVEDITEIRK